MTTRKVDGPYHLVMISLTVAFVMDEMDGTADQSAEIALDILDEQIREYDANAQIEYHSVTGKEVLA